MGQRASNTKRAAVVGSGFGGLGAAIRLQSAGIQTVLYEARDLPGGRAYVYEDEGFTFDAGPTVITAPHTLTDLFELTGRRLEDYIELMEVQPMYRLIWSDGDRFDYVRDEATMVEQIAQRSQKDAEGYNGSSSTPRKCSRKGTPTWPIGPFSSSPTWWPCRHRSCVFGRTAPSTRRSQNTSKTTTYAKP